MLGIDPGLRLTGYAVLEIPRGGGAGAGGGSRRGRAGGGAGAEATLVEAGVIRLVQGRSVARRLVELDADLRDIIERTAPHVGAVEKLYAHYKHPLTGVIMGHARGVVLLNIQRAGMDVVELGATEVKKSLTGNGHASKAQMQSAVQAQLGMAAPPSPPDIADAIAIALCCLRRLG
ncbi:MAG: crossover junction endodeoxyribonuclease RuvC [Planctomycetota bacterium]|nr:crossover junction endodeoxyribonuclease RuvC [Planctomycetota bacterium]